MHMEQWLRLIAGVIILGSVLLAYYHSQSWLWLTGLMGANLVQSGFTDWCPMMVVLRAAGVKEKNVKI
ncbi:MAG: hypothetical protein A2X96_12200 [Syntrophobacterales bacterium GWC2_56_13]|nr:MAG: hypothetical protein A2X96_12200 [Syntrophobacterales bacterium GWC2_56_13]